MLNFAVDHAAGADRLHGTSGPVIDDDIFLVMTAFDDITAARGEHGAGRYVGTLEFTAQVETFGIDHGHRKTAVDDRIALARSLAFTRHHHDSLYQYVYRKRCYKFGS